MYRSLLFGMTFVVAVLLAIPARGDSVMKGKVMSAGGGEISVMDSNGEMRKFTVASDAKIIHDGKSATLEDIDDGDVADVTFKLVGGKEVVTNIDARSMG